NGAQSGFTVPAAPGTPTAARFAAVTLTVNWLPTPAGMKTFSMLFFPSAVPPPTDHGPLKTFPLYVVPLMVTSRLRSLTHGAPVVVPGRSVQTRVIRNGLLGFAIVP